MWTHPLHPPTSHPHPFPLHWLFLRYMYMYLNIFHVDTSLTPPYFTPTPPSLALIIFKIHVHVPKYISCGHIPCTPLYTHTPFALIIFKIHVHVPKYISCGHIPCTLTTLFLSIDNKEYNRLYIFYLQIYICLESVGSGAKGLWHNPQ